MCHKMLASVALVALLATPPVAARADDDMETQLRTALRSATAQIRELRDAQVADQAKESELEKQNAALNQQLATLTQQAAGTGHQEKGGVDQAALSQATTEFNARISQQNQEIRQLNEALDKWKAAYNDAANVARTKETERAQLASRVSESAQAATSCEAKNAALFKVANEILVRYQNVGIHDVLALREPFVGIERVKMQNILQDYRNRIQDQKVGATPSP